VIGCLRVNGGWSVEEDDEYLQATVDLVCTLHSRASRNDCAHTVAHCSMHLRASLLPGAEHASPLRRVVCRSCIRPSSKSIVQEIDKVFHPCSPACQGPRLATRSRRVAIVETVPHVGLGVRALRRCRRLPPSCARTVSYPDYSSCICKFMATERSPRQPRRYPCTGGLVHPISADRSAGLPRSAAIVSFDDVFVVK